MLLRSFVARPRSSRSVQQSQRTLSTKNNNNNKKINNNNKLISNQQQQQRQYHGSNKIFRAKEEEAYVPPSWEEINRAYEAMAKEAKKDDIRNELPKLPFTPGGPTGELAVRIFNILHLAKCDMSEVRNDLNEIVELCKENKEVHELLYEPNPEWDEDAYIEAFDSFLKEMEFSESTQGLVQFLSEENLITKLPQVMPILNKLIRSFRQEHEAILTTAEPLTPHESAYWTKDLIEKYFDGQGTLEVIEVVDPSIIGGYKLVLDQDTTVDNSWAPQIKEAEQIADQEMKDSFKKQYPRFKIKELIDSIGPVNYEEIMEKFINEE